MKNLETSTPIEKDKPVTQVEKFERLKEINPEFEILVNEFELVLNY
jgi:hypothetical protein